MIDKIWLLRHISSMKETMAKKNNLGTWDRQAIISLFNDMEKFLNESKMEEINHDKM